ncbi:MAG: DUF6268 family outer membrane beta-barrel protein [Planctomycetia bacterium]|nr:DUF6268 family outer membrane beta-barrel protein [Planctomycetia bacterium]
MDAVRFLRRFPIAHATFALFACLILATSAFAADSLEPRRLPPLTIERPNTAAEAYPWWSAHQPDNDQAPSAGQPQILPAGYDIPLATPLIEQDSPLYNKPAIDAARDGFFQKINFDTTYLPGGNVSDFGMMDFALSSTYALPFPARDRPLVITPGVEAHYLDGPAGADVPPHLYDFWLKIRTLGKLGDRWGYDMAVSPGWHSDLDYNSGNALRVTGYGFAAYTWSDTVQILLGVMYLDRSNVRLIPAAGVIWTPDEDTRVELTAPRPRLARRISTSDCAEQWVYLAGEYGGGTWAIEQAGGVQDLMTYSDYRLLLGWERKTAGGINTLVEAGYVFGRQISFTQSNAADFSPTDTMLIRFGAKY